jgi:hypothetical protein
MNWYIDSVRTDEKYLNVVKSNVGEIMDWFCLEIDKIDDIEFNESKLINICGEIFKKLAIMNFRINDDYKFNLFEGDKFWIQYNSNTKIRFKDPLKAIRREIILKNILK